MYDGTYDVIYEVIARKFRAFMEPFWARLENQYIIESVDSTSRDGTDTPYM